MTYETVTITSVPHVYVTQTSTAVSTVMNLGAQTNEVNLLQAIIYLMGPFCAFAVLGMVATRRKDGTLNAEGVGVGGAVGLGLGILINVYTNNLSQWTIILMIAGMSIWIAYKVTSH